MNRRFAYLAIVGVLVVPALDLVVVEPAVPFLGLVLGLPLVLILPGYALIAAVFPDRPPELPQRLLFTVGLSLSVTILGGYLLNLLPWGLRTETWVALLGGVSLAGFAVALLRRRNYPHRAASLSGAPHLRLHLGGRQWLLLGLAALNATGAIVVARVGAEEAPDTRFTQLWILQGNGSEKNEAQIGVSNQEQTAVHFRLVVEIGVTRVAEWSSLVLQPGEKWETRVALPASQPTTDTVKATLYRNDAPDAIYRKVILRGDQP